MLDNADSARNLYSHREMMVIMQKDRSADQQILFFFFIDFIWKSEVYSISGKIRIGEVEAREKRVQYKR